ncbi:hypothetical protein CAEBREN_14781 [Caenorhabditis brenneri]|uniref:Uncharacterized protein n=1 Tax=Caenorhabditis brenneri TaxID=135651 RepID=G0NC31_CAEBE|nr:hypothetical protein CAEBREN_14781 [Caenorhabditis brenneri]
MQLRLKNVIFFIYTFSLLFLSVCSGDSSTTGPSMIGNNKDDVLWIPTIVICTRRKAQTPREVSQKFVVLRPGRRRARKPKEKFSGREPQKVRSSQNTTYWNERKAADKSEKPEKKLKTEEYLDEEDQNPDCIVEDIWAEEGSSSGAKTPLKLIEKKQKITKETPVSTTAKTPCQLKAVEKKQTPLQKITPVTELKFTNKGPINFKTQYTVQADIMISLKREPKVKISTVKWDTAPVDFYEIGLEVDQVEMLTPSTKGSNGSSSCRTASIKEMSLKK